MQSARGTNWTKLCSTALSGRAVDSATWSSLSLVLKCGNISLGSPHQPNVVKPFQPPHAQCAVPPFRLQDLAQQLAVITGFDAVSLQPNSGAAGEYAGLMAIRGFHKSNKEGHRNVCIIPTSAHGTNPASAVMAGMKVVPIGVDAKGNIDIHQLRKKCEEHKDK